MQQHQVATLLGVSPTPVREAFGVLQAERLLEGKLHHGMVVAQLDPTEWLDYYEIRKLLEVHALRRVRRVPTELLSQLDDCVQAGLDAMRLPDIHPFRLASARFHELLLEASGSRALVDLGRTVMIRSLFFIPLERPRLAGILREHTAILAALRRQDVRRATGLLDDHLGRTITNLRRHALVGAPAKEQSGRRPRRAV